MKKTQRLDKVISNIGCGTRKEVKELIRAGAVEIDEEIIKDGAYQIDTEIQKIKVNGKEVIYREFIYIMMNKPQGVISATEDGREKTVIDLLPDEMLCFEPAPVGRLDKDTEGLLLLTNDGKLTHSLLSPKKHVAKTYYAEIDGIVTETDAFAFEKGVYLDDGYLTLPAQLNILESGEISKVEITIYEGKFHQIKRMFNAVDKEVVFLKRLSMGPLSLDATLEKGSFRELTSAELSALMEATS